MKITAEDIEMGNRNKRSRISKAKSYFFKKIQWKSVKLSRFIQDKRKNTMLEMKQRDTIIKNQKLEK